jgi:hypothetical protein
MGDGFNHVYLKYKTFGGVAIGGIITLANIVGLQISGASMNKPDSTRGYKPVSKAKQHCL